MRGFIRVLYKISNQFIAAGVNPKRLWLYLRISQQLLGKVDDVPRTIHIRIAKAVSVVPRFGFKKMLFQLIIGQQPLYFIICESKLLIVLCIYNGVHIKIIQPSEYTLLRHPQTACQHRKVQIIVRLQRLAKQAANQRNHLVVVSVVIRLIQRHIIFINQQDYLPAMVLIEQLRKHTKTVLYVFYPFLSCEHV